MGAPNLLFANESRGGAFYASENGGETWTAMGISLGVHNLGGVALTHA